MSASDRILIGCTLLAMCAVGNGAVNAEPQKSAAATTTTAISLPAFLDQRRLADIQEVWDSRPAPSGPTRAEAAKRDAQQQAKAQATVQTARAAMKRAQQASEDAAVIRRRAEEISRRFSTGAVTTTVMPTPPAADNSETAAIATVQPAAEAGKPAVPQIQHAAAVHAPPLDADTGPTKPFGIGGPLPADATESAPNVAAIEANTTVKPIPPTPHPKAGAAKAPRGKTKIGSSAKPSGKAKADAGTKVAANTRSPAKVHARASEPGAGGAQPAAADEDKPSTMSEVFSGFLRAFGWNSQPE
jgi:hypothetical protein